MVSISALRHALMSTSDSFRLLSQLSWDNSPIVRSSLFAESRVMIDGQPMLLFMPLSANALCRAERFIPHKYHLTSPVIPQLSLLRREMRYMQTAGEEAFCDILLEPLPRGMSFQMALNTAISDAEFATDLLLAIEDLQRALRVADISLNNLREENIIVGEDGILHPIRLYYATDGAGNDDCEFERLHSMVAELADKMLLCDAESVTYSPSIPNHSECCDFLAMAEGLIAFRESDVWGFMDCERNIVIPPQYLWVSQFCEGRAEVEGVKGMGLIDKAGNYIIPPIYRIVDYDPRSGNSSVYDGQQWAIFDYMGELITPFGATEP